MSFNHQQSAHCESGVMSSLLTHAGLPMSEPMACTGGVISDASDFSYFDGLCYVWL